MAFPFETLKAYTLALDWVEEVDCLCANDNLGRAFTDQIQRAALSIPLNLAEGKGRWHKAAKRQFFWVARGFVFECVPLITLLRRRNKISETKYSEARERLDHLGRMISKLVQAHE